MGKKAIGNFENSFRKPEETPGAMTKIAQSEWKKILNDVANGTRPGILIWQRDSGQVETDGYGSAEFYRNALINFMRTAAAEHDINLKEVCKLSGRRNVKSQSKK